MFSKATAKIWIVFIFTLVVLFSMTGTYAWFFREQYIINGENQLHVTSTSMTIIDLNIESGADGIIKPAILKRGVIANNVASENLIVGDDLGLSNEKYFDKLAVSTRQRVELTIIGGDSSSGWMFITYDYNLLYTQDKVSETPEFERINKNVLGLKMRRVFYISEVFNEGTGSYDKVTEESLFFRNPYSTYTTRHLEFEVWFQQADEILDPKFKDALFKIEIVVLAVQVPNYNTANSAFNTSGNFSYDSINQKYTSSIYPDVNVNNSNPSVVTTTTTDMYLAPTSCATAFDVLDMYNNGYASKFSHVEPFGCDLPEKKYTSTLVDAESTNPNYIDGVFEDVCPLTLYIIQTVRVDYYIATPDPENEGNFIYEFNYSTEIVKITSVSTNYKTWEELEALKP